MHSRLLAPSVRTAPDQSVPTLASAPGFTTGQLSLTRSPPLHIIGSKSMSPKSQIRSQRESPVPGPLEFCEQRPGAPSPPRGTGSHQSTQPVTVPPMSDRPWVGILGTRRSSAARKAHQPARWGLLLRSDPAGHREGAWRHGHGGGWTDRQTLAVGPPGCVDRYSRGGHWCSADGATANVLPKEGRG